MEITAFIWTDGFTHYLFVPAYWMPFLLWLFMVAGVISLIYLVLKKLIW